MWPKEPEVPPVENCCMTLSWQNGEKVCERGKYYIELQVTFLIIMRRQSDPNEKVNNSINIFMRGVGGNFFQDITRLSTYD